MVPKARTISWWWWGLVVLLAFTIVLGWLAWRLARTANASLQSVRLARAAAQPSKIIWMYWEQGEAAIEDDDTHAGSSLTPGWYIKMCLHGWRTLNPAWDVRILDATSCKEYVSDMGNYEHLTVQFRSDILRFKLLHQYGGVWADVTLLPMKPLDQWLNDATDNTGFFLYRQRGWPDHGSVANWFIAAPLAGNSIVKKWGDSYESNLSKPGADLNPTKWSFSYFLCHHTLDALAQRDPEVKHTLDQLHETAFRVRAYNTGVPTPPLTCAAADLHPAMYKRHYGIDPAAYARYLGCFSPPPPTKVGLGAGVGDRKGLIPRTLVQTTRDKAAVPERTWANLRRYDSGYTHVLFDDDDCIRFMQTHAIPGVSQESAVRVFRRLHGAHKADLFRYYYLYVKGGVYLDIKTVLIRPLDEVFSGSYFYTVLSAIYPDALYQGVIATAKEAPVLKQAIEHVLATPQRAVDADYQIFTKKLYALICAECDVASLAAGKNPGGTGTYYLFQENCAGAAEKCPRGLDRYGLCCYIMDGDEQVIKVRDEGYNKAGASWESLQSPSAEEASQNYSVYVINLERSTDRKEHMKQQLSFANFASPIFITAVDGDDLSASRLASINNIENLRGSEKWDENWERNGLVRILNKGEIGCFLSHLKVYKTFLEGGAQYALILEDDVVTSSVDVVREIESVLKEAAPVFDFLYVGNDNTARNNFYDILGEVNTFLKNGQRINDESADLKCCNKSGVRLGTHAYVISRKGAHILLEELAQIRAPIDVQLHFPSTRSRLRMYVTKTPWFTQPPGTFPSVIGFREAVAKTALYNNKKYDKSVPKIPLIMHRTGPFAKNKIPREIQKAIDTSCRNLGAECLYYNDDDCLRLIQDNFHPDTLKAYQMLIPTAYKADLFRYCVLYVYGGIYCDVSQTVLIPYDVNKYEADLIIVKDREKVEHGACGFPNNIQISFMATIKENPFFHYLIRKLTKDILAKRKGFCPIDVTGPMYFGRTFCEYFGVDTIRPKMSTYLYQGLNKKEYKVLMPFIFNGVYITFLDGKKFIKGKSNNHNTLVYQKRVKYTEDWLSNLVFRPSGTSLVRLLADYEKDEITDERTPYAVHYMWGLWDDAEVPADIRRRQHANQAFHGGIDAVTDGKKEVEEVVERYAAEVDPELKAVYHSLSRGVARADLGRYLVLYYEGGAYLDNDITLRDGAWLRDVPRNGVWFTEWILPDVEQLGPREKPILRRVANYAFAVRAPRSPLLKAIITEATARAAQLQREGASWTDGDVLWATGPDVVSTVLHETDLTGFRLLDMAASNRALTHAHRGSWRGKEDVLW